MRCQGSTLLVCLILLVMLTIVGLAAIDSSSLEEKVTGNFRDLQTAFRSGEEGLLKAEAFVKDTNLDLARFNSACQKGLCFFGTDAESIANCRAGVSSPWRDQDIWQDAARTQALTMDLNGRLLKALYIVEFRCYLARDIEGPDPDITNVNEWLQFYRITVKAYGNGDNTSVMLQTTYTK
ncbi:MAG: PilX N-terminal domain-containing pilus assembly protein [Endozoicomonas sp. (ex Botrylloides leachii)]|nr:PilX N-terminal domain-containing pilus assembly protein [Endozoicomonas sp. (ex Botrylloides leachii)]